MRAIAVVLTLLSLCCSAQRQTADARVRSALELLAVVVDPAYQLAMDACVSRETLLADQAEAGRLSLAEADKQLSVVRVRCARQRRAFEYIREGHDLAAHQVENGAVEDAEKTIERVRHAFQDVAEREVP
jgi:hypothetical protein